MQAANYPFAGSTDTVFFREEEGPNIRISFEDQMLQFVRNYATPEILPKVYICIFTSVINH